MHQTKLNLPKEWKVILTLENLSIRYCKAIILQLKINNFLKREKKGKSKTVTHLTNRLKEEK